MYLSTKNYGPELGLSAVFRQWKAESHCNKLHGYSLGFNFVFEAQELDDRNWVVDFGDLAELKKALQRTFDHKLVVAADDPERGKLEYLHQVGLADVVILTDVGCEKFAELAYELAWDVLNDKGYFPRVRIQSVECFEHGANSALFIPGEEIEIEMTLDEDSDNWETI
jgi:6-pyruvoyltetrahydropterin/6-carboxytetrahydropterin synthase